MPSSRASPETVPETEVLAPVLVTSLGERLLLICECRGGMGAGRLSQKHCQATLAWLWDSEPGSGTSKQVQAPVGYARPQCCRHNRSVCCSAALRRKLRSWAPPHHMGAQATQNHPSVPYTVCALLQSPRGCRAGSSTKRSTLERTAEPFCFHAPAAEHWSYPSPSLPGFQHSPLQRGQPPI